VSIERASTKLLLAKIAGIIVSFIGLSIYSRILNSGDLGVFFLLQSAVGILSVPADLGFRDALEKRISERRNADEVLAGALAGKTGLLIISIVLVIVFRNVINQYLGISWIYLLLGLVLQEVALLSLAVLRGELRVGETAGLVFLRNTSWVIFGFAAFALGSQHQAPVFGWFAGFVIIILIGSWKISTNIDWPTRSAFQSLLDYSKYAAIGNVSGKLFNWTDVLLIGFFLTSTSVAAYEVAWRITTTTTVVGTVLMTTIFPHISERSEAGDVDRIEQLIAQSFLPSLFFVIPAVFGLIVVGDEVLSTFFNPEFTTAGAAIIVLMMYRLVQSINRVIDKSLHAIDKPRLGAIASIIGMMSNIILNVILIPRYGLVGAAVATSGAFALKLGLQIQFLSRFVHIRFPFRQVGWCAFAATIMFIVISTLKPLVPTDSVMWLLLLIVCAGIIYIIAALAYPPVYKSISQIIHRIQQSRGIREQQ